MPISLDNASELIDYNSNDSSSKECMSKHALKIIDLSMTTIILTESNGKQCLNWIDVDNQNSKMETICWMSTQI